ncbi:phage tail tape measure protein [Tundrisphaera sp. TA3]|uniref:phage tail tape measure protein n=1 Tax=Tundrisphaera sp. TA3 TaxID=3435775 RepID=UPI003EB904B1
MFDAYKVGITVALTNKVSQGLMLIGRDLAKTDAQALKLKTTLNQIKLLGVGGAILGTAGYAGLHALGKTLEAAKEYQQALGQFKAIGLGDAINKDADKFARGSSVIGASATDLIRTTRDLHTALGDYDMAKQLAPQVAQMKFANEAVFGAKGMDFGHAQLQAMEKIIEMKGGFHGPAEFMKQADMMQKVISATGGMVKPSDYLAFIKTSGVSGRLLDNESFYYAMEPLIQEMGGNRVGTGTMSAYNNLAQGRSTVRAAKEMMKYGLLDPSMVEYNKIGTIKQIRPGALKGMDEYTSNPYGWMQHTLIPALASKGVTSEKDVLNAMGAIFGNRTGSSLFSLMYLQQEKIEKNMGISKGAMDTRQLYALALKTPDGAEKALGAAWANLKIAMGESLWPIIIPGINKLADGLRSLGQWVNRHPVRFDYLIKGFAGLSAALAFGGVVLTLAAGFKAMGLALGVAGGTGGVVGSIGALALKLGLLSTAALAVLAIVEHQKVANEIDDFAPGIGDWWNKETSNMPEGWLRRVVRGEGTSAVPPPSKNAQATIEVQVKDPHQLASVVTQVQSKSASRPMSSPGSFDGRMTPMWGGF